MPDRVFVDTAYMVALSSLGDELHLQSKVLARQLRQSRTRLVITRAVLLEIGNSLSKLRFRRSAIILLRSFEVDPDFDIR